MKKIDLTSKELSIMFAEQVIEHDLFAESLKDAIQIQAQDGFGVMFHDDPMYNTPTILFPHETLNWKTYGMKTEYLAFEKKFIKENTNNVCYNEYLKNSCIVSE